MRTHNVGELKVSLVGQQVTLAGWIQSRRHHGGLIFVDLRDREGIVQVVFDKTISPHAFSIAERMRSEDVISITGTVQHRLPGKKNSYLATGEIEVYAKTADIIN